MNVLRVLRRAEVFVGDDVARLEPWPSAKSRDVEKHPATDDPVLDHVDRERGCTFASEGLDGYVVVELRVEDHVAQRVDVTVCVTVDVHGEAVCGEVES